MAVLDNIVSQRIKNNEQGCIFKVGDVVIRNRTGGQHTVSCVEYYEPHRCWYVGIDDDKEPEHGEEEFTLVVEKEKSLENLSVEELASLVEKAEKLLEEKKKEQRQEIEEWISSLVDCGEISGYALEHELFVNTQKTIGMLQRYLDKKGK